MNKNTHLHESNSVNSPQIEAIQNLLPMGMVTTFMGIGLMVVAPSFNVLLISAALIGVGSSTFHPEASRIVHMASGVKFGTAQSAFHR